MRVNTILPLASLAALSMGQSSAVASGSADASSNAVVTTSSGPVPEISSTLGVVTSAAPNSSGSLTIQTILPVSSSLYANGNGTMPTGTRGNGTQTTNSRGGNTNTNTRTQNMMTETRTNGGQNTATSGAGGAGSQASSSSSTGGAAAPTSGPNMLVGGVLGMAALGAAALF